MKIMGKGGKGMKKKCKRKVDKEKTFDLELF